MGKIVVIGSINKDIVFLVDSFVKAKETKTSKSMEQFLGGKGLNQSIALKKAYDDVWLCGNIHQQDATIVHEIEAWGVDARHVSLVSKNTGTAFIQVDLNGENCILLEKGANHDFSKQSIDSILAQCHQEDLIVLQNEINLIEYIIKEANRLKIPVAFNPSPFEDYLKSLPLDLLSYLIVNEVEAEGLTNESDPKKSIELMASAYPNTCVVLTQGSFGVHCIDNKVSYYQKSYQVKAVDTTAAGDTFLGYFLGSLMHSHDIKHALKHASAAAALSVTKHGAAHSIPSKEEVKQFLKDNQ